MRYFESKKQVYKNGKPRLFKLVGNSLTALIPYKSKSKDSLKEANLFGLVDSSEPKEVNEEVLFKYYVELNRSEFFAKEIIHIPVS